jgi:hypothetical protein
MNRFIVLFICILLAIGGWYYFSPNIPMVTSVKNLQPTHSYGDTVSLDVTLTNYSLQSRDVFVPAGELPSSMVIYFDTPDLPASSPTTNQDGPQKITLKPLAHQSITTTFTTSEDSGSTKPQQIYSNTGAVSLTRGSHTYAVSWGGYISGPQSLTVE